MGLSAAGESYLLHSEVLQATNNETIAKFVVDSLNILWKGQLQNNRVQLALTDAAAYMMKALRGLQLLFPKLIHLTCLAHGAHRVAETVRAQFPEVDNLISAIKKIYKKSPKRIRAFKEKCPEIDLPPAPVLTRWGTWVNAALYFATNFESVKSAVMELDSGDAASIAVAKALLEKESIVANLSYIKANFRSLPVAIEALEAKGRPLVDSLSCVRALAADLDTAPGELQNNPGYVRMTHIASILAGGTDEVALGMTPEDLAVFKFAPVTSCDVERSFSVLKHILSDRRCRLTQDHLKQLLVLYCNAKE